MSGPSDYLEEKLMELAFDNTAWTAPTSVYISLHTGDPLDDDSADTEVGSGEDADYARQAITFGAWTSGVLSSDALVAFPQVNAGSPGYTITHFGIYDALTDGNLLWSGVLGSTDTPQSRTLAASETVSFGIGAVALTLDSN